jgi:hypothetical protein
MAAESKQLKDEKAHKHPEWWPLPAGVFTASMFGGVALIYLVAAVILDVWMWGVLALGMGIIAIFEVGTAAYTAGLRRENMASILRREMYDAAYQGTWPGVSEGRERLSKEATEEEKS